MPRVLAEGRWLRLIDDDGWEYAERTGSRGVAVIVAVTDDSELLLVEQRPRAQSRGTALRPKRGEMLIFPVSARPTQGVRGTLRVNLRHGVSRISRGSRHTLGNIFHDAK